MKINIFKLLFTVLLFPLVGCSEEPAVIQDVGFSLEGDQPIEFVISSQQASLTRASASQRINFSNNDVIHIEATFTSDKGIKATTYAALKLMEGKWQVSTGSNLVWPFDAAYGSFKAFYFPKSNGVLQPGSKTESFLLSDFDASLDSNQDYDLDPLTATTQEYKYGHAVKLDFTHVCTYLTFTNLDPGVSDYFWLVNLKNIEGTENTGELHGLNNACYLELTEDSRLNVRFYKSEENSYGEDTYVSGKAVLYPNENISGTYASRARVSFFLEPGDYSRVELRTNTNHPYLSLNSDETSNLQAHIPYVIDAVKSSGITYTIEDEDNWDVSDGYEVTVKDFIEAAVKGNDYTVEDESGRSVQILEPIPNGVRLRENIRFPDQQDDYDNIWGPESGFYPNIGNGRVFEGDYHYISNIKQPLFRYNAGTIQNLGIKEFNCETESIYVGSTNDYRDDRSNRGALCLWNRTGGLITNIRVEGLNLIIKITGGSSIHTHNAGGICGANAGTISDINFKGEYSVTVQNNEDTDKVNSEITIGGITGQNLGNIYRITPLDASTAPVVKVTNNCTGDGGVFSVGGAVGYSGAVMESISLPNVNIDCSRSDGYQAYTGGLVGRLRGSSSNNSVIGCTVGGELTVGHVSDYGTEYTDSYLYTGGLAGSCLSFIVSDCATTFNVNGVPSTSVENSARYATGGIFGAVLTDNNIDGNNISNLTGWNTGIKGPQSDTDQTYNGSFSGIVPEDKQWYNYSNAGVTVKNHSSYSQIGKSINIDNSKKDSGE